MRLSDSVRRDFNRMPRGNLNVGPGNLRRAVRMRDEVLTYEYSLSSGLSLFIQSTNAAQETVLIRSNIVGPVCQNHARWR